jgi:hypothetical protein
MDCYIHLAETPRMHLKTILNHVERHTSFVYGKQQLVRDGGNLRIEVAVRSRANSRPTCSGCGRVAPGYDRLPERRFEYVPLWAIPVFLLYALRRVNCPQCGVTAERVPWCDGKHAQCTTYRWFLARWARRLSWLEVATMFRTSWDSVVRAVVPAEATGEFDGAAGGEAVGIAAVQFESGAELSHERRLPTILGLHVAGLGVAVPPSVVPADDAISD